MTPCSEIEIKMRYSQIVGVMMTLFGLSHSDTECHISERYCPDVGCVDILYRCDGCLWQQIKCPDGECKYSYESCAEKTIFQEGPCKSTEMQCEDGRCLDSSLSCDSTSVKCADNEKQCPSGRCVGLLDECTSGKYDVNIKFKACGYHEYQCGDGRCVSYQTECFKTSARGFYFYVTLPVFMVSLVFSLMCRHCKREARNARLAAYAANASNTMHRSQQQPFFRRLQSLNLNPRTNIVPGNRMWIHASSYTSDSSRDPDISHGPDSRVLGPDSRVLGPDSRFSGPDSHSRFALGPPMYDPSIGIPIGVSAVMNVPSYTEACLAPRVDIDGAEGPERERGASWERLLRREEPPPPYPGTEPIAMMDLPPPPSYEEVTK